MRGGGITRSNVWDGTMGARGPLIDCDRTLWREAGCPTESQPVADGVARLAFSRLVRAKI